MNRFFKNMKKKPTAVFHLITLDLIKCLLSDDVICISSCVCVCVSVCVIMLMTAFDSVCYFNHVAHGIKIMQVKSTALIIQLLPLNQTL